MIRFLFSAVAFAALSLSTLCAQTFESVRVRFDHPVEIAGTSVPAGDYTISMIKSNGDVPLLRFQKDHGNAIVVLATRDFRSQTEIAAKTNVVLETSGSVEQVIRIQIEGSPSDYVLPVTHHTN